LGFEALLFSSLFSLGFEDIPSKAILIIDFSLLSSQEKNPGRMDYFSTCALRYTSDE